MFINSFSFVIYNRDSRLNNKMVLENLSNLTDVGELEGAASVGEIAKDIWAGMPLELLNSFSWLLTIAKALGIVAIIYIVFLILRQIVNARSYKTLKNIEENTTEIKRKMDELIKAHKRIR